MFSAQAILTDLQALLVGNAFTAHRIVDIFGCDVYR